MNKVITVALIAGGLLLLDAPEAVAHKAARTAYPLSAHYQFETLRARPMPFRLKQDRSFRNWYNNSRLRRNRYIGWRQLYKIYRWERAYRVKYRPGGRHFHGGDFYRDDARVEKRYKRRGRS